MTLSGLAQRAPVIMGALTFGQKKANGGNNYTAGARTLHSSRCEDLVSGILRLSAAARYQVSTASSVLHPSLPAIRLFVEEKSGKKKKSLAPPTKYSERQRDDTR